MQMEFFDITSTDECKLITLLMGFSYALKVPFQPV